MSFSILRFLHQNMCLHVGMATDLFRASPTVALQMLSHKQIERLCFTKHWSLVSGLFSLLNSISLFTIKDPEITKGELRTTITKPKGKLKVTSLQSQAKCHTHPEGQQQIPKGLDGIVKAQHASSAKASCTCQGGYQFHLDTAPRAKHPHTQTCQQGCSCEISLILFCHNKLHWQNPVN